MLTKPVVEKIWSQCLQIFEGHSDSVRSIAFSSDGSRIASGSDDRTIRIWDTKSGKDIRKLEGHSDSVRSVAFSSDGSRIASGSDDHTIRIWDTKSSKEIRKLEGHSGSVWSVTFSSDGSRIASGSGDHTIRIWDTKSGKEIRKLEGHSGSVRSVAFSSDGSRIASGSGDYTIRIWDAKSGEKVRSVNMGRTPNSLRFEDSGDSGLWLQTTTSSIKLEDSGSSSYNNYSVVGDTSHMINSNGQSTSNPQIPSSETGPRWGLSGDGSWITWRGRGSIWLPPDFRPGVSGVSSDGSAIAIGRSTGRVVVLRMSMDVSFS